MVTPFEKLELLAKHGAFSCKAKETKQSVPFAVSQLAKKLRLEENFNPKLTRFFKSISRTIKPVMSSTGQIPSMAPFRQDLIELLTRHYDRVSNAFKGDTVETLTKNISLDLEIKQETIQDAADESSEILDEALLGIIALRAPTQADFILETTEKELNKALEDSIVEAAKDGRTLSRTQLAKEVSDDFDDRIPGRVENINTIETQAMAEDTKMTEAQVVSSNGPIIGGIAVAALMKKTWHTILDERTRSSHVAADRQERRMPIPFTVQGQSLMVPGDTSLGASLSNVAGCRCAAEFRL